MARPKFTADRTILYLRLFRPTVQISLLQPNLSHLLIQLPALNVHFVDLLFGGTNLVQQLTAVTLERISATGLALQEQPGYKVAFNELRHYGTAFDESTVCINALWEHADLFIILKSVWGHHSSIQRCSL